MKGTAYGTQLAASHGLAHLARAAGGDFVAFHCEPCGGWHVRR